MFRVNFGGHYSEYYYTLEELQSNLKEEVNHHFQDEIDEMTLKVQLYENQKKALETMTHEQKFQFLGWEIEEKESIFDELYGDKLSALIELSSFFRENNSDWIYPTLDIFIETNYYSFLRYLEEDETLLDPLQLVETWWKDIGSKKKENIELIRENLQ